MSWSSTETHIACINLILPGENIPRTQWRIGKINKLVVGKDAQIRGAE